MTIRILILVLMLSVSGCTIFRTKVSAVSDATFVGCCSFVVVPGDQATDTSSLYWRTLEKQVTRALERNGFAKAESADTADIGIVVAAGIGQPRTVTTSREVIGQTGSVVTGSKTTGTVNSYGFGNNSTVNANTTYTSQPTYGVVGTETSSYSVFDRWLIVSAYDLKNRAPNGDLIESWRTSVNSAGTSGDLQMILPYMITAAEKYFGENLSSAKTVEIIEGDRRVKGLIE